MKEPYSGSSYPLMKNILLVEDDCVMSEITCHYLVAISDRWQLNSFVELLTDGQKAVNNLMERSYDLIFLDIGLPMVNGHEVLRRIRIGAIYTPVIMLSSSNNQRDVHLAYMYGANGYLVKDKRLEPNLAIACQCFLKSFIPPMPD